MFKKPWEMTEEEQIAQHYKAALDSVKLINDGKPAWMGDEEWDEALLRNREHLRIMLAKDFWTTEDLEPLRLAAGVTEEVVDD
jgi:hypothetical protein